MRLAMTIRLRLKPDKPTMRGGPSIYLLVVRSLFKFDGGCMETPRLPTRDKENEVKIIAALRTQGIEVSAWEWRYLPQLEQWDLIVKTPWVQSKDPQIVTRVRNNALVNAGIDADIASRVRLEIP